jgi:hypothetical protein
MSGFSVIQILQRIQAQAIFNHFQETVKIGK